MCFCWSTISYSDEPMIFIFHQLRTLRECVFTYTGRMKQVPCKQTLSTQAGSLQTNSQCVSPPHAVCRMFEEAHSNFLVDVYI